MMIHLTWLEGRYTVRSKSPATIARVAAFSLILVICDLECGVSKTDVAKLLRSPSFKAQLIAN